MRAFMSTGAGHAEDGSRYVSGLNVESAMSEACAILETAEGWDGASYLGSERVEWNHFPAGHGLKEERAALAEALRAFVGA